MAAKCNTKFLIINHLKPIKYNRVQLGKLNQIPLTHSQLLTSNNMEETITPSMEQNKFVTIQDLQLPIKILLQETRKT